MTNYYKLNHKINSDNKNKSKNKNKSRNNNIRKNSNEHKDKENLIENRNRQPCDIIHAAAVKA